MRHIYLAAVAAAVLMSGAGAAAAQDWSGPYIGLTLGGAVTDDDEDERVVFDTNLDGTFTDTVNTSTGVNAFGPTTATPGGFCGGKAIGSASPVQIATFTTGCVDDDNIQTAFSARIGFDMQSGPWVYGAVIEASSTDVQDATTAFSITPAAYVFTRDLDDVMYAARLRFGYSFGRSLVYVTGGAAMSEVTDRFTSLQTVNSFTPVVSEDDATGYQLGLGGEMWMTDRVTLGVEYLYTSLDAGEGLTVRSGPSTGVPATNPFLIVNPLGTDLRRSSDDFAFHGFRLTLTGHF